MTLFVIPNFNGGGAERVFINIANELTKMGQNVEFLVLQDCGPLKKFLDKKIRIHSLKTDTLRRSIFKIHKALYDLKPKNVLSTFGYVNILLILIIRIYRMNSKLIIREANMPSVSLRNNSYYLFFKFSYKFLYRFSDLIICSSETMKKEFIHNFNIKAIQIKVLENPVNVDLIESHIKEGCQNHSSQLTKFVAIGRLSKQKGFDRLINWFSEIDHSDAFLKIIGEGGEYKNLIALIRAKNLQSRVFIENFKENPWIEISCSNAVLIPSRWEGMPNIALEALVCGTKIIATNSSGGIGEIKEYIPDDNLNIVNNDNEFKNAMSHVIESSKSYAIKHSLKRNLLPNCFMVSEVARKLSQWL